MYGLLFKEIASYQAKADDLARNSRPNAFLRNYHQTELELPPDLAAFLIQTAVPCAQKIVELDSRAMAIIKPVKDRYRKTPGSAVPPLPKELGDLDAQRTAIILAAADSLSQAFGPAQFAFFENIVRHYIGSSFKPVPAPAP